MINTRSVINLTVFALVLLAVAALYLGPKYQTRPVSAVFTYEEIRVVPKAVSIPRSVAKAIEAVPAARPAAQPLPILPPRIISQVLPTYPDAALAEEIEGAVLLSLRLSARGEVSSIAVKNSSGNASLDNAASAAVAQWKFSPATQGGAGVDADFEVPVRFVIKS